MSVRLGSAAARGRVVHTIPVYHTPSRRRRHGDILPATAYSSFSVPAHVLPVRRLSRRFSSRLPGIFSGWGISPITEDLSGRGNTVSFITGKWNVPHIAAPQWVNALAQAFPAATQGEFSAISAGDSSFEAYTILANVISHGLSCSSWIGIQDNVGGGGLVQAGVDSVIPSDAATQRYFGTDWETPDITTALGSYGLYGAYFPFFEWTSAPGAVFLPLGVIVPGDTIQVSIQILEESSSYAVPGQPKGHGGVRGPGERVTVSEQLAIVYFSNLTQAWYTSFAVPSTSWGATTLSRSGREAIWTVEQSSDVHNDETPRGAPGPIGEAVMPIALHGTVFFRDAYCGSWTQSDGEMEPLLYASPQPSGDTHILSGNTFDLSGSKQTGHGGYLLHYPGAVSGGTLVESNSSRYTIVDTPYGYVVAPLSPIPIWPTQATPGGPINPFGTPPPPPAGPEEQPYPGAYGTIGTVASGGQLIAEDIIMCKYTYPDLGWAPNG
jgi:hypothetical protein